MNSQSNKPETFLINPLLESIITSQEIEILHQVMVNPQKQVSSPDIETIRNIFAKATDVLGEDLFMEPLYYLAASRHGLRATDLQVLLGKDWNLEDFRKLNDCFGFPILGENSSVIYINSPHLRYIIFGSLSEKEQQSFHEDIAFYLLKQPIEDPARGTETLFHLLQCRRMAEAAAFFGASQGESLHVNADTIGSCFASGEDGEKVVETLLQQQGDFRFDMYRRCINEVFISLAQHTNADCTEKYIKLIEKQLLDVMGVRNSIDNIELLALTGLRIASVKLSKNEIEEVKKYFDHSIGLINQLMSLKPESSAFRWDNCDAIFNLGMICMDMRQPKAAQHCFDIAFTLLQEKDKTEQTDSPRKHYYASWYVSVCRIFQQVNDKEAFKHYFEQGKSVLQASIKQKASFAAQHPEMVDAQRELMVMYCDFGDLCHLSDYNDEAQAAYENSLIISERLATKYPDAIEMLIAPSMTHDRIGKMFADLKENKKAQEYFELSLNLRKDLSKRFKKDPRLLNDLASAYHNLAGLCMNTNHKKEAEEYLIGQTDALMEAYQINPMVEESIISMLDTSFALGDYYFIQNLWQKAGDVYDKALQVIQPLLGKQVSEHVLNRIAYLHFKMGHVFAKMNNRTAAHQNITVSAELWKQLSQATNNKVYKDQLENAQEMLNKFN